MAETYGFLHSTFLPFEHEVEPSAAMYLESCVPAVAVGKAGTFLDQKSALCSKVC